MLKIYASSTDRVGNQLLSEKIVSLAKESGISGCTVYRGIIGYGTSNKITISKFWEITEKLPVIIEIVDNDERIEIFWSILEPVLKSMEKGCLVTRIPVEVILKKPGAGKKN